MISTSALEPRTSSLTTFVVSNRLNWLIVLHALGLLVAVGIVDDPDEAEAMAALGVDLLCTDDPVGLGLARAGAPSADTAVVAG